LDGSSQPSEAHASGRQSPGRRVVTLLPFILLLVLAGTAVSVPGWLWKGQEAGISGTLQTMRVTATTAAGEVDSRLAANKQSGAALATAQTEATEGAATLSKEATAASAMGTSVAAQIVEGAKVIMTPTPTFRPLTSADIYATPTPTPDLRAYAFARMNVGASRSNGAMLDATYATEDYGSADPANLQMLTAGADGTVLLWDSRTGEQLRVLRGHVGAVRSVRFGDDGRILSAGEDGTVRVWPSPDQPGGLVWHAHAGGVYRAEFSPGVPSRLIATCGADGTAKVWDSFTDKLVATLSGHTGTVNSVAWSSDGKMLVTAGADGTVRVWDAGTYTLMHTISTGGALLDAAFAPDGMSVATAGADGMARLWNLQSEKQVAALAGHAGSVTSLAYSHDGRLLLTGGEDGTVRVWSTAAGQGQGQGQRLLAFQAHQGEVTSVGWSIDNNRLLTAGQDGVATVWGFWRSGVGPAMRCQSGEGDVNTARYSPDGTMLATCGKGGTLVLWDATTGEPLQTLNGHTNIVNDLSWNPDGTRLVSGADDGTARIWAKTGSGWSQVHILDTPGVAVMCAQWSPDGRRIVTCGADHTATIWDSETGGQTMVLRGHTDRVSSAAWSPDGSRIVTAGWDGAAIVWDASSGQPISTLHAGGSVYSTQVAWSNSNLIAMTSGGSLHVWDGSSGAELVGVAQKGANLYINSVAFSPDGARMALVDSTGESVRIWDAHSGDALAVVPRDKYSFLSATYSPDGKSILAVEQFSNVQEFRLPPEAEYVP
jgi:WD40 repeat protein